MFRVAFDRHDVDGLRLVRVDLDREAEVGGQVAADFVPRLAGVVAAHDVPVLLHEQHSRARPVHRDAVDAVADLRSRVGNIERMQPAIDRLPCFPASSVRNAPADEIAMKMRSGLSGSRRIVCRHIPPAPGGQ